jgi:phosphopantetheine--protein transferase-like protein
MSPLILIGHDIQSIKELEKKSVLLNSPLFFSNYEREYCSKKTKSLASLTGLLCAKEALVKAFTGLSDLPTFTFSDFEIRHSDNGRPKVQLNGNFALWCQEKNVAIDVSISHSEDWASATVLLYNKNYECE